MWVAGARPRTLGAAVAPVLVGTAAAVADGRRRDLVARASPRSSSRSRCRSASTTPTTTPTACAAPTSDRRGPAAPRRDRARVAGRGAQRGRARVRASPRSSALVLSLVVNPWLLLVGVAAIAAAVALHRRPEAVRLPRARRGDGARVLRVRRDRRARAYVQLEAGPGDRVVGRRSSVGLLACAILLANNVRDIADRRGRRQAHARGARRRADARGAVRRAATSGSFASVVVDRHHATVGAARPPGAAARGRSRCASMLHPCRPAVARRRAGGDVELEVVVAVLVSVGLCLS